MQEYVLVKSLAASKPFTLTADTAEQLLQCLNSMQVWSFEYYSTRTLLLRLLVFQAIITVAIFAPKAVFVVWSWRIHVLLAAAPTVGIRVLHW